MSELKLKAKEKLLAKIRKEENGCWNYTGYHNKWGYGRLRYAGKKMLAHRLSYFLFRGELVDGKFVCHTCDNPKCVNPNHLFLGTAKDNHDDAVKKGRIDTSKRAKNRWKHHTPMREIAEQCGISLYTLRIRIRRGATLEQAIARGNRHAKRS